MNRVVHKTIVTREKRITTTAYDYNCIVLYLRIQNMSQDGTWNIEMNRPYGTFVVGIIQYTYIIELCVGAQATVIFVCRTFLIEIGWELNICR